MLKKFFNLEIKDIIFLKKLEKKINVIYEKYEKKERIERIKAEERMEKKNRDN